MVLDYSYDIRQRKKQNQRRARENECRKRVIRGGSMANLRDPQELGLLIYLSDMSHWPSSYHRLKEESYEAAELRWRGEEPARLAQCVTRAQEILNALSH